jgi:hypothetical protein
VTRILEDTKLSNYPFSSQFILLRPPGGNACILYTEHRVVGYQCISTIFSHVLKYMLPHCRSKYALPWRAEKLLTTSTTEMKTGREIPPRNTVLSPLHLHPNSTHIPPRHASVLPSAISATILPVLPSPYHRRTSWHSKGRIVPAIKWAPHHQQVKRNRRTTPCFLNLGQRGTWNELHAPTAFPENEVIGPRNWSRPFNPMLVMSAAL